ncbi:MAG TPA: helix-turn-helix transcriptional regulator [Clostridiaceae bacterium]
MPTFGQRFQQLRTLKNYTQDELAKSFNKEFNYSLSKPAISQYENDKRIPEINVLMNFATYFKVTLDYLLGRDQNIIVKEENTAYSISVEKNIFELTELPTHFDKLITESSLVTLDGKPAKKKSIDLIKASLEIGIELSKRK